MLRYLDLNFFVYFINECTVSTKKNLNNDGPCFVICPFITFSPDELYFKRLEELSLKKINNMKRISKNGNVNNDSANLKYNGGIKDC